MLDDSAAILAPAKRYRITIFGLLGGCESLILTALS